MEQAFPLRFVLYVGLDEKAIGFTVNVFDAGLKYVKASNFWNLNFRREVLQEVFINDAV